jgi:hypothetical protein
MKINFKKIILLLVSISVFFTLLGHAKNKEQITIPKEGDVLNVSETSAASETKEEIIKRLEVMESLLVQWNDEDQLPLEVSEEIKDVEENAIRENLIEEKIEADIGKEIVAADSQVSSVEAPDTNKGTGSIVVNMAILLGGMILISGVGFFVWIRYKLNRKQVINWLKLNLSRKEANSQQKIVSFERMVKEGLKKERKEPLENEENKEKEVLEEKEKADSLVKQSLCGTSDIPHVEEDKQIKPSLKPEEKRALARVSLTKDFSNTVILRVKSENAARSIKCFAKDISLGGLCFETRENLDKDIPISLRLFFYGDRVPIIKARGNIVWKKAIGAINYYGVTLDMLEDKDMAELNSYVAARRA